MLPLRSNFSPISFSNNKKAEALFLDKLTTDARGVQVRNADPGPGIWTGADYDGLFYISGGALRWNSISEVFLPLLQTTTTFPRTVGMCFSMEQDSSASNQMYYGNAAAPSDGFTMSNYYFRILSAPVDNYYGSALPQRFILQTTGAIYVNGDKLIWVTRIQNQTNKQLSVGAYTTGFGNIKNVTAHQLGAPWNVDWGLATYYNASAPAGTSFTHEANGIIQAEWSPVSGNVFEIRFRQSDATNMMIVRCTKDSNNLKLVRVINGNELALLNMSYSWTAAKYRVAVRFRSGFMELIIGNATSAQDNLANSYTDTFNMTATGGYVSHAVTNLVAWPYTIPSAALTEMNAVPASYLLNEQFSVDTPAPLIPLRASEPGPGNIYFTEPYYWQFSGGRAVHSTDGYNEQLRSKQSFNRSTGVCFRANIVSLGGNGYYRIDFGATNSVVYGYYVGENGGRRPIYNTSFGAQKVYFVLRTQGAFIIKDRVLIWAGRQGTYSPLRIVLSESNGTTTLEDLLVANAGGPFATDNGLASYYIANPPNPSENVSVADAWHEFKWTVQTGQTLEFSLRRTNDSNRIVIRLNQSTSTAKIIKIEGGVETELTSVPKGWTNNLGYRFHVYANGSSIVLYQEDYTNNYLALATSTFNQTEIGTKISGHTTGYIADWASYPINLTPEASAALDTIDAFAA